MSFAVNLTTGLVMTLTLVAAVALCLGLPPKQELKSTRGSNFAAAVDFIASDCFSGTACVNTAGFCASGTFFSTRSIVSAGLGTGLGLAAGAAPALGLGLVSNRKPKTSKSFTLAGIKG